MTLLFGMILSLSACSEKMEDIEKRANAACESHNGLRHNGLQAFSVKGIRAVCNDSTVVNL